MAELSEKQRDQLSDSDYAFPKEQKEPINDAKHVRNAVARFDQVEGVSNAERDEAWKRIQRAANKYDVDLDEGDWRELFKRNDRPIPKD
jgi:cell division protein FtsX